MAADESERALKAHEGTYQRFTGLMKYGAVICFIVAILVVLIIRN
ncbi:hypothetical protein GCM10023232_12260 [Sphingosinicella ginsenosidimutans]|uniref:Aa3-type cytochrome c oxidase subunit IV n=1 Tax=Allosphingosinicella ginsenosidimutans TaxID=1176539 RepID=A0A5C6TQQ0_9SPHN|nr:aa3-type cytochrome c oxidase subunit IV [Sphingosinicella ginsenosidimutans]TXC62331.1 aa3-type cytochrome c oxidase subunit IV [Sphingosinicella ginsenosidimutans]